MMRRSVAIASLFLCFSTTALAGDDAKEQSRAAFRRGVSRIKEENFEQAKTEFLEAYRLFPHPSILLNLGLARIHLGEYVEAEQDLTKFIADDGGATTDEIQSARGSLSDARDHLGTLKVQVSPDHAIVTLDKKPVTIAPGALSVIRTTAGMHALHVEATGYDNYDEFVTVVAKDESTRRVALYTKKVVGSDKGASGGGLSGQQVGGIVLLGGAAAFLGAGIVCGLRAQSFADTYNNAKIQNPADKDDGILLRTLADVSFGAALVSGAIGTYLLVSSPKKKAVTAQLGPGSISIAGQF